MGVVCCDDLPKLAREDADGITSSLPSAAGATAAAGATTSVATLPSDRAANHDDKMAPSSSSVGDQADNGASTKFHQDTTKPAKKSVRINAEATVIPLLTSASFFRKTPKPTTITSSGSYGIMPAFRIVTPAAISSGSSNLDDTENEDDLVPKARLWYTKEERREILHANQRASRDFKRFQPTKLRKANLVYDEIVTACCCRNDHCERTFQDYYDDNNNDNDNDIYDFFQRQHRNARTASTSTSTSAASATTTLSTKKRKRADFAPTAVADVDLPPPTMPDSNIDLPTNVRGLEWGVMPDAKRYRKSHAKTVLGWQDRIRRMNAHRRRRRYGHDCDKDFQDEEWHYSSSSSSSSSEDDDDRRFDLKSKISHQEHHQQDLLLGQKASMSSLRSCILARVLGKSDEIAANPLASTVSDLEKHQSSSDSPTPSLAGTTDESESESSNEDDDDEEEDDNDDSNSDENNESESSDSDSDAEEDDDVPQRTYYTTSLSMHPFSNPNSHHPNSSRRMFRPRMMPPRGWH